MTEQKQREALLPRTEQRKAAEQEYTITAFDYVSNPVGSRDWELYWKGYQAGQAAIAQAPAVPITDDDVSEAVSLFRKAVYEFAKSMHPEDAQYMADRQRDLFEVISLIAAPSVPIADGKLTITKNEAGQIVAVTRTDDEHRILEVVAESAPIADRNAIIEECAKVVEELPCDCCWPENSASVAEDFAEALRALKTAEGGKA